ncbi:MAG: hypothetical protein ABSD29_14835 [Verrucomicrobiota bacterium]|jgi:acetolactate synthase small subunit
MPDGATFESFQRELTRLVDIFGKNLAAYKSGDYDDKMLALTPKLRAAKTDAERQTLQNAVTATDQQIDALVYELYGLTPQEIALVEGGGES